MKNLLKELKKSFQNFLTVIENPEWKKEVNQDFEFNKMEQK